jgi:hypothetical protein
MLPGDEVCIEAEVLVVLPEAAAGRAVEGRHAIK